MKEELIQYIKEELLVGQEDLELNGEDDLLGSGLLDSLSIMRLIAHVEAQYGVKIPPQDMTIENFETVDALCGYLEQLKSA